VVEGNTAFALDLYTQLKDKPGNLFFSPYSISTALAMTYTGARGNTAKQMGQVLHFSQAPERLHTSFGNLERQLAAAGNQDGIQFNIANALWTQQGHPFVPAFLNAATREYQANVSQADFKTGANQATEKINAWVGQQTKGKIQDILPPGSLTDLTRLVLANAVYFKGAWANRFAESATSPQLFHLTSAKSVQVPLMNQVEELRYGETADFQAVELPYKGEGLSMVVLLPRQIEGCGSLENRLTSALLSGTLKQMKKREVVILLPKFKLESTFNLDTTLANMGMRDAFTDKADFSGIDGTKLLYISDVFHKAWGEVNEEGTEAAAATAIGVLTSSYHEPTPPPPVFRADHPFIFLIRHPRSGSLLFLGRLADPTPAA
jgi:serpin B